MRAPSPHTVGQRIKAAREQASLTQLDIAKHLGLSRAAVAQWEADVTSPSIAKLGEVASLMHSTPQYLAYGIDGAPITVVKPPEGTVSLTEVAFGAKADERLTTGTWNLPETYLKSDLHVLSTDGLIVWRVESDDMAPTYEYGDRIIIDTNAKRVSPPGVFLIWDGVGPSLAHINVVQVDAGKQKARITPREGNSYEAAIEKLSVIGRVKGRIHAS